MEKVSKKITSVEEEVFFLREHLAQREKEALERGVESQTQAFKDVQLEGVRSYSNEIADRIDPEQHIDPSKRSIEINRIDSASNKVHEIMTLVEEKGIYNALSVAESLQDPFTVDEVHKMLVEYVKNGVQIQGLKESVPPWQILHTTLFEVVMPEIPNKSDREHSVKEIVSRTEQFFSGMQSMVDDKKSLHLTIEIAVENSSSDIVFYVSVPNQYVDLFEKQLLSLFPHALITERVHDYNIFIENGSTAAAKMSLKKHPIYPIRNADSFDYDPLSVLLNSFSKIDHAKAGAAIQIMMRNDTKNHIGIYQKVIEKIKNGEKTQDAIKRSSLSGDLLLEARDLFFSSKKNEDHTSATNLVDSEAIEVFNEKISSPIVDVSARVVVSATSKEKAESTLENITAGFNQFEKTNGNKLVFEKISERKIKAELKAFSFREFHKSTKIPLSLSETALLVHFPIDGITSTPQFKQSRSKTVSAPVQMPTEGTLVGVNNHRGLSKEIYLNKEDRLRHFYIIGQTGTGKTTLMKNIIIQDIHNGDGVCMIDPHGTDIEDILGAIPPARYDDVIYFDPSRLDRAVGLNMLEYDETKPEQKTFVVNELFSIFQKLYGSVPESMGPMFEQYFRNATMLVLEDTESGSTLLDISRVLADAKYRQYKLARATNPVVVQFWSEIAGKAGGEASLENIVPYITSKFDVFTANDYMRPIIGQQKSAFNFREIMDNQKILLVNLSKGRLGEINANLIGMIFVGKLLMAALSRVDDPSKSFAPFYLHMDEFQNVSTNSISAILSEARKYKMGLTLAHQFIAQLDEGIKDAVFGNVGSVAAFRVGPEDAQFLETQFQPEFTVGDLMNTPNRTAVVKLLADGVPTFPFTINTVAPPETNQVIVQQLIEASYQRYGKDRAEIEEDIANRYLKNKPPQTL